MEAIACTWTGKGFLPTPRFQTAAAENFAERAVYWLNVEAQRTDKTHKHEFAWIKEAWRQLPDELAESYPTAEHLRKRALIQGGYFDEQAIDAGSNAAALRVAQGIRAFPGETFSMVFVRGPFCIVRRAQSQSHRAMGAQAFNESKRKILEIISEMIGVEPATLERQREAA